MDLLYDPGSFTQGPEIRKKRSLFREFSVKSSKTYKQSTRTYSTGYFLWKWSNNYMQSTRIWHSMPWSSSKITRNFCANEDKEYMQSTRTFHSMSWTFFKRSRTLCQFLKLSASEIENTCKPYGPCTERHGPSHRSWTFSASPWKKGKKFLISVIFRWSGTRIICNAHRTTTPVSGFLCTNGAIITCNPHGSWTQCHGPLQRSR